MKLTLDIEGLSLCHFDKHRLAVAMLNAEYDRSLEVPRHYQTLVLPRSCVDEKNTTATPVTLAGRVRDTLTDADNLGFELERTTIAIGPANGGPPARSKPLSKAEHPDPADPDWRDMRWVMDVVRFMPNALLSPEVLELGNQTASLCLMTEGKVQGAKPQDDNCDSTYVWDFTERYRQAVTDSLQYEHPSVTEITLTSGREMRKIALKADGKGHLINEATPRDIKREEANEENKRYALHARAFYSVFTFPIGSPPPAPRRGRQFRPTLCKRVEGIFCIIMTVGAD